MLSALGLSLTAAPCHAEDPAPLVVVVSSNPDAPFVRRLAAELSLFGYRVEVIVADSKETELEGLLQQTGSAALIAVDQGDQTAEVVVSEQSGPARHERERLDPRRRPDTNAAILAERFRARLTELGIAPGTAPPVVARPPVYVPPPPAPVPPPDWRLWLAGGVGVSSGGLGATPEAELELRAFPVRWLSTSAFGRLSLVPAEIRAPEGETDVRLLAGGVLIDAYPIRSDWSLKLGVGALLVSASMEGQAAAPFGGEVDSVLVPAGIFDAGGALRLSPRVVAELRGFVGASTPRVGMRFGGRTVARFGQPWFGASIGLAVGVF